MSIIQLLRNGQDPSIGVGRIMSVSGARAIVDMAISDDASYIYVTGAANFNVSISTDFGATWTNKPTSLSSTIGNLSKISCSSDGRIVVARNVNGNYYCVSTDFGETWVTKNMPSWNYNAKNVIARNTMTHLFTFNDASLFSSADFGTTWGSASPKGSFPYGYVAPGDFGSIATSADGKYVYARDLYSQANSVKNGRGGGGVFKSSDFGVTFIKDPALNLSESNSNFHDIVVSDDGSKIVTSFGIVGSGVTYNGLKTSSDFGATWETRYLPPSKTTGEYLTSNGFGASNDCEMIIISNKGNSNTYLSGDNGLSWQVMPVLAKVNYINTIKISADKTKCFLFSGLNFNGNIYSISLV